MKKVFISQPIQSKLTEEKNKAIEYLESKGYEVVNKTSMNELDVSSFKNLLELRIIAKNIHSMAECDAIYFLDGWTLARNCRIERLVAILYNIEIIEDNKNETAN